MHHTYSSAKELHLIVVDSAQVVLQYDGLSVADGSITIHACHQCTLAATHQSCEIHHISSHDLHIHAREYCTLVVLEMHVVVIYYHRFRI